MASLTGQLVAETYKALLKLIDNDILTASEKQITDGFGGGSNVFIDSQGFLRANKYKVTNGLATQFLKADGSLDSNAYLTSITGAQVITALGYTPVPTTRTITINGETHNLAADNSWTVGGTAAIWGNITGTLSNQTDLQNALNAKYNNPTGTISQYIRGDGTIANFPALTGYVPYSGATSNVNLGEYGITSGFVGFDTTPTGTPTGIGTLYWDSVNRTLSLIDGDGDTTLQIGQEERVLVHNNTGATLTDGQIVYVTGSTGELPSVALASNSAEATSSVTFGMVTESIAHGADGFITTSGIVHGLNTLAFTEGAALWLGTTPGTFTQTKPVAPLNSVLIGYVIKKAGGNGSVFVKIQNGYELEELHDVYIADPANNHGLFYDISDGLWKNKSIASALGYTPQAQLSGTGFVKASGTTITYDNSTYLTTTDAASTYQRLDKMVSNLLPSATEYPNSNAVIAALALKADALNPVFTGYMTISGAEPKLYFTDTDQNPDYFIGADAGFFRIYDQTAGATRFVINSSGVTTIAGDLIVGTIAKSGGTASQFLKADGSIDSNSYVTSASLADYLLISTAASTYQRLDKMVSNLLPSSTEYPNSNAVINALALKADAANPVFTGNMTISGATPRLYFVDTDQNPDYTVFIDSGYFYIYDQTVGATRFSINSSGNINTGVGKSITAGSFIKESGTASQFLMADGSVSTGVANTITGSLTSGYVPKATGANTLANSLIYDNGTNVGIGTIYPASKLQVQDGDIRLQSSGGGPSIIFGSYGVSTTYPQGQITLNDAGFYGGHLDFFTKANGSSTNTLNLVARIASTSNFLIGTTTDSGHKLSVNGTTKSNIFTSSDNTSYQGLGAYNNTFIGAGNIASALIINDIDGARYAISAGSYSLTFSKNVSGTSWATAMAIVATSTTDNSPVLRVYNKLGINVNPSKVLTVRHGAGDGVRIEYDGNNDNLFLDASNISAYSGATPSFLKVNATGGNVSIGFTTDSGYKLDVNGQSRYYRNDSSNISLIIQNDYINQGDLINFKHNTAGSTTNAYIGHGGDNTGNFVIINNGITPVSFARSTGAATFANRVQALNFFSVGSLNSTDGSFFIDHPGIQTWKIGVSNLNTSMFSIGNDNGGAFATKVLNITNGGNVMVGTTTNSGFKFDVVGTGRFTSALYANSVRSDAGITNTGNSFEQILDAPYFTHGVSNLAFDVRLGNNSFWGYIQVEVTGTYSNQNTPGKLTKVFSVGTNPGGSIYNNESRIVDAMGEVVNNISIGDFQWDSSNSTFKIPISHIVSTGNGYSVRITMFTYGGGAYSVFNSLSLSPLYTLSALSRNYVYYNDRVGFGTTSPSAKVSLGTGTGAKLLIYDNSSNVYSGLGQDLAAGNSTDFFGHGAGGGFLTFGLLGTNKTSYTEWARFSPSANFIINSTTDAGYKFQVNGSGHRFSVSPHANGVDIHSTGNLAPHYQTDVTFYYGNIGSGSMRLQLSTGGSLTAVGSMTATSFFESSDIRLKTLIESNPIIDGIEKLEAKLYEKNGKIELGYFAQDAELIMPYAVTKGGDGFLNLSYREVHTAKIARLEKEVAQLKAQLNLN